jgi:hypothetical protein
MNTVKVRLNAVSLATLLCAVQASAQTPFAIAGRGNAVVATLHAEGAQIYDCKPDSGNFASPSPRSLLTENRSDDTTPGRTGITSMEAASKAR